MKRREFIGLVGGAAAWPLAARAQQPAKMKRVAMVNVAIKADDMRIGGDPYYAILFDEMKRLGYAEGVNLIVDRYSAEGRVDRFPEIAREIVATRPDVIYTVGNPLTVAFKSETRTIPIVAYTGDPVAGGIVSSLARPGGNITGVSGDAGPELGAKRIELLAEAVGKISNLRVLGPPTAWEHPATKALREAAEKKNILVHFEPLQTPIDEAEYTRAFEAMQRNHVDGVAISGDPDHYYHGHLLGRLARQYRLPVICTYTNIVEAGALMSYAFDLKAGTRRVAAQIVEILNGGKPEEMPYFMEAHFELVINLKAAKEIGLEIPAGLIAQADRVIE
jgi:putative tryptophan/tyrosine transport system substrate-binding protein